MTPYSVPTCSSLLCVSPQALQEAPFTLTLHHCQEKSSFFSQALRHCRYVQQRRRTLPQQSCLKYPDWLVRFILESLGGRREYQYGVSEKSPAWIRMRVNPSCDAGWNLKKNTEIGSPVVTKGKNMCILIYKTTAQTTFKKKASHVKVN